MNSGGSAACCRAGRHVEHALTHRRPGRLLRGRPVPRFEPHVGRCFCRDDISRQKQHQPPPTPYFPYRDRPTAAATVSGTVSTAATVNSVP